MKKILVSILGIAAMAASACQPKEQAEIATPSGVHEISVTFTADLPGTRTFIEAAEGGWQPKWQKGDAMNVTYKVDGDYTAQKSFVNTLEDGTTGSFSGNLEITDGTHTIYAYYPKDMKDGRAETTFKFALPAVQNVPSLSTFDPSCDLLVSDACSVTVADAALASAGTLHFNRVLAVAKVVVADATTESKLAGKKIKSVTLRSSAGTLTGRVLVNIETAEITGWDSKVSYNYVTAAYEGDDWAADGKNGAFVIVNPVTLAAGSTLTAEVVTDDDDLLVARTVTLSAPVALQSGVIPTLTFNIADGDVSKKSEVTSLTWDFSTAEWQAALEAQAPAAKDTKASNWGVAYGGLSYAAGKDDKWSVDGYIQSNGAGSTSTRYFTFTAPADGKLSVSVRNPKDTENESSTRTVSVKDAQNTVTSEVVLYGNLETREFNVKAGTVNVYASGNGLRFFKLVFTTSGAVDPEDPGQPDTPAEAAELTIPDNLKPTEGTVDPTAMVGFAQAAGVTGGEGGTVLHFNNGQALQTWLLARTKTEKAGDHTPVVIWLSGTFTDTDGRDFSSAHPWFDVKDVSNLSFYGTDGFVMDRIGIFCVRANNIIIRNINFQQPKANNGADAVSMQQCNGVWVDHCTFTSLNQTKDYEDGSTDITHASKNVTVSWCRYIKTQKSCLVGHSNSASADVDITATFHHNWFDGSSSRHPRVRFGWAHVYNNLYEGCTTYGAGSAYGAKVLVEYNYFDAVQLPTDICTFPAKDGDVSNLQGSVAGYLFAGEDVYVNRPAKARNPYPLTNLEYKKYNGDKLATPLTYADFKPAYAYTVTPAENVPEVVKANAGYGKLGWTEAPVAVDNGGITDFNGTDDDPENPEQGDGDDPEDTSGHTYTLSVNDGKTIIQTKDGAAGASYFTSSTSLADFSKDYSSTSFTVNGTAYKYGIKFDSKGSVTFTTSSTLNSTAQFYFVRRKSTGTGAKIQLVPAEGEATVFETPYDTVADSGEVALEKGMSYTLKQKSDEQALIYVIVKETE